MTILERIIEHKKSEVMQRKQQAPRCRLIPRLPLRNFAAALTQSGIAVIAEIKKCSPSTHTLRKDINPAQVAHDYERFGARAISVLTDERFFGGNDEDLQAVRNAVVLPVLRKEFIIDEYQIYESRKLGADAILFICRILTSTQLSGFVRHSHELGMACMVEVHSEEEIEAALASGTSIIGINNRDLDTLRVDRARCINIRKVIPDNYVTVAESGIEHGDDVRRLEDAGFDGVLIGETLMRSDNLSATFEELLGRENGPA